MKKQIIILFLFCFSLFTYKEKVQEAFIEKINLNMEKGEIGIVFLPINSSNFLLLKTVDTSVLIPIEGEENPSKIIERFGEEKPDYSYTNLVEGKKQIDEKEMLKIENVNIKKEGKNFIISMEDTNFCIFYEGDINTCDYVYFIKETRVEKDTIKLAFYNENLSSNFESELYDHWIDTYKIKQNEFTLLTFQEGSYNVVKLPSYYFQLSDQK